MIELEVAFRSSSLMGLKEFDIALPEERYSFSLAERD